MRRGWVPVQPRHDWVVLLLLVLRALHLAVDALQKLLLRDGRLAS
jgi:hypothetical protein